MEETHRLLSEQIIEQRADVKANRATERLARQIETAGEPFGQAQLSEAG
jgi:hypothetical protein